MFVATNRLNKLDLKNKSIYSHETQNVRIAVASIKFRSTWR